MRHRAAEVLLFVSHYYGSRNPREVRSALPAVRVD
jgi:hypothetical protein